MNEEERTGEVKAVERACEVFTRRDLAYRRNWEPSRDFFGNPVAASLPEIPYRRIVLGRNAAVHLAEQMDEADAAVGTRWIVVEAGGGERHFGRDEAAARRMLSNLWRWGQSARLFRLDPIEDHSIEHHPK